MEEKCKISLGDIEKMNLHFDEDFDDVKYVEFCEYLYNITDVSLMELNSKCWYSEEKKTMARLRLNLDGEGVYTLKDLGGKYGVSRERVRQLVEKVLKGLKRRVKNE